MRIGNNIAFRKTLNEQSGEVTNVATYKGIALKTLFYLFLTVASAIGGLVFGFYYPEAYVVMIVVAALSTFSFSISPSLIPLIITCGQFAMVFCL